MQAFRKVDVDYPLTVARLLHEHGAQSFAFNSSIGANPKARAFYMRVKGEVEQRLIAGGFPSLTLVRPSGILGPRKPHRAWEARTIRVFHSCGRSAPPLPPGFSRIKLPRLCWKPPSPLLPGSISWNRSSCSY
jgi:uncharacterized protein YbjT (DUF2867 family)